MRVLLSLLAVVSLTDWHDYFVGVAGSAAALTGLITVAVSIGLNTIIAYPQLPDKALGSIILLLTALLIALFCLAPGQPVAVVGAEVLATGLLGWGSTSWLGLRALRATAPEYRRSQRLNVAYTQLAMFPYLGAGVVLLTGSTAGLYGVVVAAACSFCKATLDAWVLLIEIHR